MSTCLSSTFARAPTLAVKRVGYTHWRPFWSCLLTFYNTNYLIMSHYNQLCWQHSYFLVSSWGFFPDCENDPFWIAIKDNLLFVGLLCFIFLLYLFHLIYITTTTKKVQKYTYYFVGFDKSGAVIKDTLGIIAKSC